MVVLASLLFKQSNYNKFSRQYHAQILLSLFLNKVIWAAMFMQVVFKFIYFIMDIHKARSDTKGFIEK